MLGKTNPQNTIVTACNSAYFWGAFLLVASVRYNQSRLPIIVSAHGLTHAQARYLLQFNNVSIRQSNQRLPHLHKATALTHANTEYITWLDADCVYSGNIDDLLIPCVGDMQIRFRCSFENQGVFANTHPKVASKGIPQAVLNQWCRDIGERENPRFQTQCVTNAFCLHRSKLNFLVKWQQQINQVSPTSELVDHGSKAYYMSDESVLASMLCFATDIPEIAPYQLDNTQGPHLMHFGRHLKPWGNWRLEHLAYYDYLQDILKWVANNGYEIPALPLSLNHRYRSPTFAAARLHAYYETAKSAVSPSIKQLFSRFA